MYYLKYTESSPCFSYTMFWNAVIWNLPGYVHWTSDFSKLFHDKQATKIRNSKPDSIIKKCYISALINPQWKHLYNKTNSHTTGFKIVVKGCKAVNVSLTFVLLDCQANHAYLFGIFVMRTRVEGNTWLTLLYNPCQSPQHGKTSTWDIKSLYSATKHLIIILIPPKVFIWKICNSTYSLKTLPPNPNLHLFNRNHWVWMLL